jgi:hypothetical protein
MVLEARGLLLSSPQIHTMCNPGHLQAFGDSSSGLIGWVVSNGARIFTDEEGIHDETARLAVLAQMPAAGESLE